MLASRIRNVCGIRSGAEDCTRHTRSETAGDRGSEVRRVVGARTAEAAQAGPRMYPA